MVKPHGFKVIFFAYRLSPYSSLLELSISKLTNILKIMYLENYCEPTVYVNSSGDVIMILFIYVNGIVMIQQEKIDICFIFEMRNLGAPHCFLGVEFWHDHPTSISQFNYATTLLEKF